MTQREYVSEIKNKLDTILSHQDKRDKQIESIHRALYGDEQNEVTGLVHRQKEDEAWRVDVNKFLDKIKPEIDENTKFRKNTKTAIWGTVGGGTIGAGAVATFFQEIKEVLTKLF